jgi:hypothetical protein
MRRLGAQLVKRSRTASVRMVLPVHSCFPFRSMVRQGLLGSGYAMVTAKNKHKVDKQSHHDV